MAQYASPTDRENTTTAVSAIANPVPLGLSALAFTTAILGCSYAGFIVPSLRSGMSIVVATAIFYGGIVQILAGMWEFRTGNTVAATVFSAYGGFLAAFGLLFLPNFGFFSTLSANGLHSALGLFFLCWTIFTGVLFLGSFKSSAAMELVLLLLFVSFLFLTIGQLASASTVLLAIGGWFGVATAIVAWYTALAGMLSASNSPIKLPMGRMRS